MDRLGPAKAYSIAVSMWSLAADAHAVAQPRLSVLGGPDLSWGWAKAANFPACIKTVGGNGSPRRSRALAPEFSMPAPNVGAVVSRRLQCRGGVHLRFGKWLSSPPERWPLCGFDFLACFFITKAGSASAEFQARGSRISKAIPPNPEGTGIVDQPASAARDVGFYSGGNVLPIPVLVVLPFWLPKYLQEIWPGTNAMLAHVIVYNAAQHRQRGGGLA